MYKLTIVSGPNRGASYELRSDEVSIGRQTDNAVTLTSSKVSKRHCTLVASNGELLVKDEGSANGTFVNGMLVKQRKVKPGDRIGVGEFVLEITETRPPQVPARMRAPSTDDGQILPFPGLAAPPMQPGAGGTLPGMTSGSLPGVSQESSGEMSAQSGPPSDPVGKALWYFDKYFMTFFYGMAFRNEWRFVAIGLFAVYLLINLFISVQPLLDSNRESIIQEIGRRAGFMAKQIAERNAPFVAAGADTKTEISQLIQRASGVRVALLTDLDNRVIAPPQRLNTFLATGYEAKVAAKAAKQFREEGVERGLTFQSGDIVAVVEPVKIFIPALGRNEVKGMAIVSMDAETATMGIGEASTVYSMTLLLSGLLGVLLLLILYRLTVKPLEVLAEDMDKALKGELAQVTHEFKFEEMVPIWEHVNTALQRIPRNSSGDSGSDGSEGASPESFVGPLRMLGDSIPNVGIVVCGPDRKVLHLNMAFEDITGIRASNAIGQTLASVAPDQGFEMLANEAFDRAAGGLDVAETSEFSGVTFKVNVSAFLPPSGGAPAAFLMMVRKAD